MLTNYTYVNHTQIQRRRRKSYPQKALVIDLDGTLIHSAKVQNQNEFYDFEIMVNKRYVKFHFKKRPYLRQFLLAIYPHYEIVIFTASKREYSESILGHLDVSHLIDKHFVREDCNWNTNMNTFIKDLKKVRSDMSKVILIDDCHLSAANSPENLIPIKSWTGDPKDRELEDLIPFLMALKTVKDVRPILQMRLKTLNELFPDHKKQL